MYVHVQVKSFAVGHPAVGGKQILLNGSQFERGRRERKFIAVGLEVAKQRVHHRTHIADGFCHVFRISIGLFLTVGISDQFRIGGQRTDGGFQFVDDGIDDGTA